MANLRSQHDRRASGRRRDDRRKVAEPSHLLTIENVFLLDLIKEGIFTIDLEGRCTFMNESAGRTLGYRAQDVIGAKIHELIHHTRSDGSAFPIEHSLINSTRKFGHQCKVEDDLFWRS